MSKARILVIDDEESPLRVDAVHFEDRYGVTLTESVPAVWRRWERAGR